MFLLAVRSVTIESLYKLVLIVAEFAKRIDCQAYAINANAESANITDEVLGPVYVPQAHHGILTHL